MQIHEITTKINEGFMDAVKGIGSIAASGINQAIGTNIGGTLAGAHADPLKTQQQALQLGLNAAKQQATTLAAQHQQLVKQLAKQSGNADGSLNPEEQEQLEKVVNRIVFGQLVRTNDLNSLSAKVDKADQPRMAQLTNTVASAIPALDDPVKSLSKENINTWVTVTQAAAEIKNLLAFNADKSSGPSDIFYDQTTGQFKVRGQPYDPSNPIHKAAMAAYQASRP